MRFQGLKNPQNSKKILKEYEKFLIRGYDLKNF